MDQSNLIWMFALGFPLFFAAVWVFVARILSTIGWSKYLPAFAWDHPVPPAARRFSWATMVVGRFPGGVSYNNAMTVWIDQRGVYLRPSILFRIFHPTLHFGWDQVASIEPRKTLWIKAAQLSFRRDVPMLTFGGRAGKSILEHWHTRQGRSQT